MVEALSVAHLEMKVIYFTTLLMCSIQPAGRKTPTRVMVSGGADLSRLEKDGNSGIPRPRG